MNNVTATGDTAIADQKKQKFILIEIRPKMDSRIKTKHTPSTPASGPKPEQTTLSNMFTIFSTTIREQHYHSFGLVFMSM